MCNWPGFGTVAHVSSSPDSPSPRRRFYRLLIAALLAVATLAGLVLLGSRLNSAPDPVALSAVTTNISSGNVTEATLNPAGPTVTVTLKDGSTQTAYYPSAYADTLTTSLLTAGIETNTSPPPGRTSELLTSMLFSMIPMLLFIALLVWVVKSGAMTGGISAMKNGRGDAIGAVPKVSFADVAGADEAVEEMREIVDFLTEPDRYLTMGATPPRGALLVGPPGTGKTLLARAVAGEAGVPFFPIAGSDFVETFVGVGARRVRDLFDQAKKAGKAIIFIDEIDAVGRERGHGGGDAERDSTLIAMLNEMDGFNASGIIVMAATNRPELLDKALTRPGRLDRQIHVPLPDRRGREQILSVHLRNKPAADDVDVVSLAHRTAGFSGADLARVVNDAAINAARDNDPQVHMSHCDDAVSTVALGRARESAIVTDKDRQITAWHEAGHTLAAICRPHAPNPVQVSIIPRGPAGGATWMEGSDDVFLTRQSAYDKLVVALAGREAEKILLAGDYTSGAHSDLVNATNVAEHMVTQYGMGERLAVLDMSGVGASQAHSAAYAEIDQLLHAAGVDAGELLALYHVELVALAELLLDQETLSLATIREHFPHLPVL